MPSLPAVSILLCVHNRERFVEEAVRSVLAQSFGDLELILVNDASTDESRAIIERLAAVDPRVRVFHSPPPARGAAGALKAAHTHARATLLGWVDSDDLLAPTALRETVEFLSSRPHVGMVYTDHFIADEAGNNLGVPPRCSIPYTPERLLVDFMTFHFRLFRREVFTAAGGIDDSFPAAHDYDFCLRASEVTRIERLARPLYAYRVHRGSISSERRLEQIQMSARAIRAALRRRGMDATHELDVEVVGRYTLRQRRGQSGSQGGP